jgi:hypothetical protein
VHQAFSVMIYREMLDLHHQHNKYTTPPHMRICPSVWSPPSCEGVLCTCCAGDVQQSNPYIYIWKMIDLQHRHNNCTTPPHMGVGPTHVRGCCAAVVVVLCRNQISIYIKSDTCQYSISVKVAHLHNSSNVLTEFDCRD